MATVQRCNPAIATTRNGSYVSYQNILLRDAATLGILDSHADEQCMRVCDATPGCSAVTRASGASVRCFFHTMCVLDGIISIGSAIDSRQFECRDGATTLLAANHNCAAIKPKWSRLAYRLPIEGSHLGVVAASNAHECRKACDMMPGCNSFAKQRTKEPGVLCHLKGRCAPPGSEETRLDQPGATSAMRAQYRRLVGGRFNSHYRWPCSNEELWPLPGVRRSLPPIPTGLVSLDCAPQPPPPPSGAAAAAVTGPSAAAVGAAFVFSGSNLPARDVVGYCDRVRAPRPDLTQIRWPDFYRHARTPLIPRLEGAAATRQAAWQGRDAHSRVNGALVGPRLFDTVARDVARRSFNGKEVILLTTNKDGLPLVINLIANLAQIGHTHVLVLADAAATCRMLVSASPPACVYSTILRDEYPRGLRTYVSNTVWILWLQRYLYFLQLMKLDLNPLLLDADIVLFHDPYPLLKGALTNYTLFSLCDASAGYASANGGVWYAQNANVRGPTVHLFAEFERRVTSVLAAAQGGGGRGKLVEGRRVYNTEGTAGVVVYNAGIVGRRLLERGRRLLERGGMLSRRPQRAAPSIIRYDETAGHRRGQAADILVYDQSVINNVLLSSALGREANLYTHTPLDMPNHRVPAFWRISDEEWTTPPALGTYDTRYPSRYARRERTLEHGGLHESILQAPPWLFSAESDARVPPVSIPGPDGATDGPKIHPGRPAAALWGARPPPAALVHFVCAAWPGSGGRMMAMQLWGKWYHRDIAAHLGHSSDSFSAGEGGEGGESAPSGASVGASVGAASSLGFDAHSWMRVCGLACAVGRCTKGRKDPTPVVEPCTRWIAGAEWHEQPLLAWHQEHIQAAARGGGDGPVAPPGSDAAAIVATLPSPAASPFETTGQRKIERKALAHALAHLQLPPALVAGALAARTSHPRGLIAFRKPLAAADRREYQLYVHLLMSAAMLTGRVPVLPLALCSSVGEWSDRSRCVYVMHSSDGTKWCVQRPPSICHAKVALPNSLEGVGDADAAIVKVPRLPLLNGTVDVRRWGAALGAAGTRPKRVLLLDVSDLETADDVSNLLATPKGWLCTLEHKSCQNAC